MIAVVFPGQGSQKPGMGTPWEEFETAQIVFREVSEATGIDMVKLCRDADEDTLRRTDNAQLALYTVSFAAYRTLLEQSAIEVAAVAGHSVGEFAALVAAGVFTLEDGAKLVQARGETMAEVGKTRPGAMAAVLGLDASELVRLCAESEGLVAVANDNSPGQVVISGEAAAVADLGTRATAAGAKRVIPLNVSGAFHSPLMQDASVQMRGVFDSYPNASAKKRIYSNVTSEVELEGFVWPDLLERQLRSPVRWTETVQHMVRDGVDTIIECGPGEVLSGLIRRIDKSVRTLKVNDSESLAATRLALENQA